MKHKTFTIGLLIIALVAIVVVFGKPYEAPAPVAVVTPERTFDPEALAIRDKIYAKNKEYGAKTKRQTELQKEIDQIAADKEALVQSAASYDTILYTDYRLCYQRPSQVALSGSLTTTCDFQ